MPTRDLTEADLTDFKVTYRDPGRASKTVHAAYVTADQMMTYMLAFKDHEHRTVTLVAQDEVLSVDRLDGEEPSGFRTTSQVMEQM